MLKPLPNWKSLVTLAPYSGLQFLDFAFNIDETPRLTRSFLERRHDEPRADGLVRLTFHPLENDEDESCPAFRLKDGDDQYEINKVRALEPFLGKWVPVPYLRIKPGRDEFGQEILDKGPTNWARILVTALRHTDADRVFTHRVLLAFDTDISPNQRFDARGVYVMPSVEDVNDEQEYRFAYKPSEMSWFISDPNEAEEGSVDRQEWVDGWLLEMFREFKRAQRPGRPLREEDFQHRREHWARYLTFLELIDDAVRLPRVKLLSTARAVVDVDLVLDVGNSRTCGIMIETYPIQRPDDRRSEALNNAIVLRLRDLSQPAEVYSEPFESRVEFSQASIGRDHLSRRSGRARAFFWPSPVRIGPEAYRFAEEAEGTEASTGMSSPKRYLWDDVEVNQDWRFQSSDYFADGSEPLMARTLRRFVTQNGDVIRQVEAEERRKLRKPKPGARESAERLRFSRSSLYSFMIAEIVAQTLSMINDPAVRAERRESEAPRRLRQIICTLPPATPLQEQRIARSRMEGGVKLVWDLLDWTQKQGGIVEPRVVINFDEASCTHLVYLYTEITQKLAGAATEFLKLQGRPRPFVEPEETGPSRRAEEPSLRIASIDIGGGTTDLMITTYYVEDNRAIKPTQNFREGFRIAGDDIAEAVVERVVLPSFERFIAASGARDPHGLLKYLFGGDRTEISEPQKHSRQQFVLRVCAPIALAMLRGYEDQSVYSEDSSFTCRLADLFPSAAVDADASQTPASRLPQRIADYLERPVREAGGVGFRIEDCVFTVDFRQLGQVVRLVLQQVLSNIAEAINELDCDMVLLSGRPSRLPTVFDMLVEMLPVTPDRIVPMHQYSVGSWYPFRSNDNSRISDPKTTAAVGAMLCHLAESHIRNFMLFTGRLRMRSTARFIGEMELNGQILNERLIFRNMDLDSSAKSAPDVKDIKFFAPMKIGFRQLALERWMATPLYRMDFRNAQAAQRFARPLTVTLERAEFDVDEDAPEVNRQVAEALKEEFVVTEVVDAKGATLKPSDVELRLQTLNSDAGYWLDTGILSIP